MTQKLPAGRCDTRPGLARIVVGGLLAAALGLPCATAQTQAKTPPSAPPQAAAQASLTLPLSPIEKAEKEGTAIRLSLKELTKMALQNNLDIAISDTNEEVYQQRLIGAYGPYDPTVSWTLGVRSTKSPNTNQTNLASGRFNKTDFANWNFAFAKSLPTGGDITGTWNSGRSDTNQVFALFTPQFNATSQIQFRQPLLRNRRIDATRSQIKLINLDLKTNDSQFRKSVTDTIARIQALYWDLVNTIRDFEIKRKSVELAQITLQNNQKKVEIGTLAPIGITEAQAELANREVDLIVSEERIYSVQNNLRALISNDRTAEIWRKIVVPTETPEFKDYKVNLDEAIDAALRNRPELEQLAIKLQQSDINILTDQNSNKWQFDLTATFGSVGVAGPQTIRNGQPMIVPELVGALGTAYKTLFTQGFTNWNVGFNIQIPLRNRSAEARLAQDRIAKRQLLMNRKSAEQSIQVEIRNSVQAIETSKKRVDTARVARELAKEQLDGEEKRFQAGLSENFRVLDRQRSLSQAEGVELQAMITYKKAIIDLQKAMYTLLESSDFEIAKSSSDNVPMLK